MQLWNMLGRKANNLGRVVDGERNANMGAQKAGQKVTGAGVSVQDELQSFFAETQVRDEKVSKVPVKGTIMSFFAKQKQKASQSLKKSPKNECTECPKELSKSPSLVASTMKKATILCQVSQGIKNILEWDCEACTFHNTQLQQHSDEMTCEMCGTHKNNVIDMTDSANDIPVQQVTPSNMGGSGGNNHQTSRSQKTRDAKRCGPELVKVDDADEELNKDIIPRKLVSSLQNPIVLSDIPEEIAHPRKKHKVNHQQSELKNLPINTSRTSTEDESKVVPATLLSFSVSKNSGRVTIHFNDSGESSLTNFELEQIVTEETADRLTEARLNRSYHAVSSIVLAYNESALSRCKNIKLRKIRVAISDYSVSPSNHFEKMRNSLYM